MKKKKRKMIRKEDRNKTIRKNYRNKQLQIIMSASTPDSTYVIYPELDHILTILLGLDLTGPDNLHVEMF